MYQGKETSKSAYFRNSLAVQRLGLHTFTAEGPGSISGRRTRIPKATWRGQKKPKTKTKQNAYFVDCVKPTKMQMK